MIQGSTQIENTIAYQDRDAGRNLRNPVDAKSPGIESVPWLSNRIRRWFRVWFVDDAVGFSIDPRASLCLEAVEAFACPVELVNEPWTDSHNQPSDR